MPAVLLKADIGAEDIVEFLLVWFIVVGGIYVSIAFAIGFVGGFAVKIVPRILVYLIG